LFLVKGILEFGEELPWQILKEPTKGGGKGSQGNLRIKGLLKGGSKLGQKRIGFNGPIGWE